ncbi:ubiquinol-cytochrome c reductase complex ubiquinone-binding protein [Apiospora arundinis]
MGIGRSWPAVGIVSIARYLAACGFRPKECHEAHILVQLANHDFDYDHNLNRRLMGSFLAFLHPEPTTPHQVQGVSLHDLLGHREAGMVLFDAPMFQLVCSQCGRSEAGSDLALHEMGTDEVCGLSRVVWAQQESPQACTEEVFGLQELQVGNGVEGWLASTIPGGDPCEPRRLLLCASPHSSASKFARGRRSTLAITSSSNGSDSAPIRRSKRANM